jgi:hypothetical protein
MTQLFEGVGIALSSLRASKVRAALTILGVAIGVMVVVVIGSMITGINRGVEDIFNQLGPRTFFVFRYFSGGINVSDGSDEMSPWRRMPPLTMEEAGRIRDLPSITHVVTEDGSSGPVEFGSVKLEDVPIRGRSPEWTFMSGGDVLPGRSFTLLESEASSRVVVINEKLANELFGHLDPIGKRIRVHGVPYEVIGVHIPPPDIFGESNRPEALIPHKTFQKYVPYWRGWMNFLVLPSEQVTVQAAIDDVTGLLRSMRSLRPAEENNFAVVTQDRLLDSWHARAVERGTHGGRRRGRGHHDDLGDRAHARDRRPQGAGRQTPRDPVAVPRGSRHPHPGRWRHRNGAGRHRHRDRQGGHVHAGHDPHVLGGGRPRDVGAHRRRVRDVPGGQGGAAGSGGGAQVRVAGADGTSSDPAP